MSSWPSTDATLSWLDAINLMLASVAAEEVTDADPSLDSDVAMASKWLNAKDLEVQAKGWAWNTDENYLLSPDPTTSFIMLPENTLGVNAAYWANVNNFLPVLQPGLNPPPGTPTSGQPALVAQRGLQLYDQINHTFTFTQGVYVDLVTRLNFEDTPNASRMLSTMRACQRFQATKQGANIVFQADIQDIKRAEAALETIEDRARPANAVGGNLSVMRNLYGSGVRRNRGVF